MAKRNDKSQHDKMIFETITIIENAGFENIKADVPGYALPNQITPHIPDISATNNRIIHIFEVETGDTVTDAHTESQWTTFAKYAEENGSVFHVVVPKEYEDNAESQKGFLGITAEVITL